MTATASNAHRSNAHRNIDPQHVWDLTIGGDRVLPSDNYAVIDPNTTEVVGYAPDGTAEHSSKRQPLPRTLWWVGGTRPWPSVASC